MKPTMCVILAFGDRVNSVSPINKGLLNFAIQKCREFEIKKIVIQKEACIPKGNNESPLPALYQVSGIKKKKEYDVVLIEDPVKYLDTWGFLLLAEKECRPDNGDFVGQVLVICHLSHKNRVETSCKRVPIFSNAIILSPTWIGFDKKSIQKYTRTKFRWYLREIFWALPGYKIMWMLQDFFGGKIPKIFLALRERK